VELKHNSDFQQIGFRTWFVFIDIFWGILYIYLLMFSCDEKSVETLSEQDEVIIISEPTSLSHDGAFTLRYIQGDFQRFYYYFNECLKANLVPKENVEFEDCFDTTHIYSHFPIKYSKNSLIPSNTIKIIDTGAPLPRPPPPAWVPGRENRAFRGVQNKGGIIEKFIVSFSA
jgi:hypothetical protein